MGTQSRVSAEQIAQRLENLKNRLGDQQKNLAPEIDQIVQQVRQLEQSQSSQSR